MKASDCVTLPAEEGACSHSATLSYLFFIDQNRGQEVAYSSCSMQELLLPIVSAPVSPMNPDLSRSSEGTARLCSSLHFNEELAVMQSGRVCTQ